MMRTMSLRDRASRSGASALTLLVVLAGLGLGACSGGSGPDWIALELTLDAESTIAGTPVGYTAELVTESGQRRAVAAELSSDVEAELEYTETDLTPTVAGTHLLTATATEGSETFTGEAELMVEPAEPVSIELSLNDDSPELNQRVTATALILDVYGNESGAPWTLTATAEPGSDVSSVTVEGHTMTFNAEGWFSAVGTVDGTSLSDRVGPFLVDSFAPTIEVTNPARGTFTRSFDDIVTGTVSDAVSDIASVTVNGAPATLDGDGGFSYAVTYEIATNLVETIAVDTDTSTGTDRRAVLAGEFVARDGGVGNGVIARVNQSTIDAIEDMAEELVASYDVASMIPDPVYRNSDESCLWGVCVTWYELILRVRNLRYGRVDVELDPTATGTIAASATVHDIAVDWNASGVVTEIGYSASGTISADSITVSMHLTPSVRDGALHVDVSSVLVSSEGFVFDFDSWIYDAARFFGLDASGLVQSYVEDAIREAVIDEVPPLLEETLRDLELGTDFEVFGNTYHLLARPYDVSVDDAGITLSLETFLRPDEWRAPTEGLGSLYAGYGAPSYDPEPGMVASFSADFLNQALYAFWGGGMLAQTFGAEEIGVDPAMLGLILDELSDLEVIVVNALLPPVVLPGEEGALLGLQIGDLEVLMYRGDPSNPENLLLHFYAGFEADMSIGITERNTLAPTISNVSGWVDVTEPVLPHGFEVETEELILSLIPMIEMQLGDALGEIPIPDISGFTLSDITVEAAGPEGGYINAAGDLTSTAP